MSLFLLHALDEHYKSICGAEWEFGRTVKDFRFPLELQHEDIEKCIECQKIILQKEGTDASREVI